MTVVQKPLSELFVADKNIRRHTDKQIAEYIRSIQMFGQIKPIVVADDGEILAGNGLFIALKQMGAETCDCYVIPNLSAKQRKKLMLADNRVYELGVTDMSLFDDIIRDLEGDIDVPGWDADLLQMLNASIKETTDEIGTYGIYDQSQVEHVEQRERVDHSELPQQPAGKPQDPAPAATERIVVCPKCGERICL